MSAPETTYATMLGQEPGDAAALLTEGRNLHRRAMHATRMGAAAEADALRRKGSALWMKGCRAYADELRAADLLRAAG